MALLQPDDEGLVAKAAVASHQLGTRHRCLHLDNGTIVANGLAQEVLRYPERQGTSALAAPTCPALRNSLGLPERIWLDELERQWRLRLCAADSDVQGPETHAFV